MPDDDVAAASTPHEFHARIYEVYAMLGGGGAEVPWTTTVWTRIRNTLDPLLRRCSGPPAIRTVQLQTGPGSPNQRGIGFGRIGWSGAGADRWTHAIDGRLAATGDAAEFLSCEAWAPSWTAAARNRQPPDLYWGIASRDHLPFRSVCLLAVAAGVVAEEEALRCAGTLAQDVGAVFRARCTRPWGIAVRGFGYTRAINDLTVVGLFRTELSKTELSATGRIRAELPSLAMLDGDWDVF